MGHPLLLLYSIGHGILAIVAGTSIGFVEKLSASDKYGRASTVLKIVMGALFAHWFYLFYSWLLIKINKGDYDYGTVR